MSTQKIYDLDESTFFFADSAQTPSATLTLSALAASAGRISAQYDRGAGAKATKYRVTACFQLATAGTVGEASEIYIATGNGTVVDGTEGTSDAALSSVNKLNNLTFVGAVITDTTSTDTDIVATFEITITARYLSVVVYNRTTDAFRTSTSVHSVKFIPVAKQAQALA